MSSLNASAELMQGFRNDERFPEPPIPVDLQMALDEARTAYQAKLADQAKLITERDTLPLLINKAASAGNTVLTRQLKARQNDIALDIMQSEIDVLTARLEVEKAKAAIGSAQEKAARQRIEDAVAAQEAANKAVRIAKAAYAPLLGKSLGSRVFELENRLEAARKRNAQILTGKPDAEERDYGWMRVSSGWRRDYTPLSEKKEVS